MLPMPVNTYSCSIIRFGVCVHWRTCVSVPEMLSELELLPWQTNRKMGMLQLYCGIVVAIQ